MRISLRYAAPVMLWLLALTTGLRADVLEMQNGDRYSGKVLSVSADTVVLNSGVLGKINVPRNQVAALKFGTNAAPPLAAAHSPLNASTNPPAVTAPPPLANTNVDLAAAFRQLGAGTNFVGQIRQQMVAGSPAAAAKYDELVNGLLNGQMDLNDLRRQAQASADQLRAFKRQLGPDADESLDEYLKILDAFVNETPAAPASVPATSPTP